MLKSDQVSDNLNNFTLSCSILFDWFLVAAIWHFEINEDVCIKRFILLSFPTTKISKKRINFSEKSSPDK